MTIAIQEDDIGITLNPTVVNPTTLTPIDLTTISSVIFRFLSPISNSVTFELVGAVDGDPTLGKVIFTTTNLEFKDPGTWKYQIKLFFLSGAVFFSDISKIKVKSNI